MVVSIEAAFFERNFTREDIIRFIEAKGIAMYDNVVSKLSERLYNINKEIGSLVRTFLHCS